MTPNAAYMTRVRAQRRAAGQCIDCGILSPRLRCQGCRRAQADARSARNIDRVKRGLCTRCPERRQPARTMCGACLDYYRGRKRRERFELMIAVVAVGA